MIPLPLSSGVGAKKPLTPTSCLAPGTAGELVDALGVQRRGVAGQEVRGTRLHGAVGHAHRDGRREAVPCQVDAVALEAQRVVDRDGGVAGRAVRGRRVAQPGRERGGLAGRGVLGGEAGDLVDAERRRLHAAVGGEASGLPAVVLRDGVAHALALPHDRAALVAVEPADGDEHERDQQRDVEDQVAGLAAVTLLGRERDGAGLLGAARDAPAPAQGRARRGGDVVRRQRGPEGRRTRAAGTGCAVPAAGRGPRPGRARGCAGSGSRRAR